jgi:hypothetical protein
MKHRKKVPELMKYITSRGMGGGRMEVMRGWEYTGRDERVDSFLHISFCVF